MKLKDIFNYKFCKLKIKKTSDILLNYLRNFVSFIRRFKFSKVSKNTLNTVQNMTVVILNKEERKQFLRKKLKQNKIKLFFEFLILLSVVLLIGLNLFLQQIDPNDFKKSVENSIKQELDINLSIKGDIKWSVFKVHPAIELNDIIVDNIIIDKVIYKIKLGTIKARISLISLLNGENIISKIHLKDIAIISSDNVGIGNFKKNLSQVLVSKNKLNSKKIINTDSQNKNFVNSFYNLHFNIKEIVIRNTSIKLRFGKIKETINVNNLIIQHILDDSKLYLSSKFVYQNNSVNLSIITPTLKYWLHKTDNIPIIIKLSSLGNIFEWNLVLKNINQSFVYIGKARFISDNFRNILKMFTKDDFYVGKINLSTNVIGNTNFMSLQDFNLKIANSDIRGNIDFLFKNLSIDADLKSSLIDLPKIFWPNWRTDGPDNYTNNSVENIDDSNGDVNVFGDIPLFLDYLSKVNFNIDISVAKLKAMPEMPINNITAKLLLNNKIISSDIFLNYAKGNVKVAGVGYINDKMQLDASLSLSADAINIGEIVDYTGYEDFVNGGNGQAKIFLKSIGTDLSELMSNINGGFKIYSMDKIHIKEISSYMKGDDIIFSLWRIFSKSDDKYDAYIECAVGNGTIDNGVYETGLGFAIETNKLNIVVDGKVDLGHELIDVSLLTFPKSGIQFSGNAADMVNVSGSIGEPDVKLRLQGSVVSVAKTGLLSAAIAPVTGGLSLATFGIGFVTKTVWDNIVAKKNPCNVALTLPVNDNLSQNVYTNEYNTEKSYKNNVKYFNQSLKKVKKLLQSSLR